MIRPIRTVFQRSSLLRYSLVGAFCAALNLAIQITAVAFMGLHYLVANLLSFAVLVPLSFALQRRLTFRVAGHDWVGEFLRYTFQWLAILIVTLLMMLWFVDGMGMHGVTAILLVMGLLYLTSYFGQRYWVFGRRRNGGAIGSGNGVPRGDR